jgi:hypothetical protein
MDAVVIDRMDRGPRLVIEDPAALALDFFSQDASSVGADAYDARAGRGARDRITTDDVRAINQTMRARSPHSAWEMLTTAAEPLVWLAAIDPEWDLIAMDDGEWAAAGGADLLAAAIEASVGPYRQLSVASKVLHLKRPRLFPVLDSLVVEQVGGMAYVKQPARLLLHLRAQGRNNLTALRSVQQELAAHQPPYTRTLVRVLDALLWATHPTAGLASMLGRWEHVLRLRTDASEK